MLNRDSYRRFCIQNHRHMSNEELYDYIDNLDTVDGEAVEALAARFNIGTDDIEGNWRDFDTVWSEITRALNPLWYAVQINTEDDWSIGSFDKAETIKMLMANENYTLIAVIENGVCIEEIYKEDL